MADIMTMPSTITMTADEFEALPERNLPTELINGELVMRGAPSVNHQRLSRNITRMLLNMDLAGELFYAPTSVKLDDRNYFQPDVLWIAAGNTRCTILDDGIEGAPDLVVEVLSPGTAKADRGIKFEQYAAHGVREYWIVEPTLAFLQVWVLVEGVYQHQGVYGADETFASPVLQREITLTNIFMPVADAQDDDGASDVTQVDATDDETINKESIDEEAQ